MRETAAFAAVQEVGEPIGEPVAAYGPFVMSTAEEIEEAIRDVRSGKLGWRGRA